MAREARSLLAMCRGDLDLPGDRQGHRSRPSSLGTVALGEPIKADHVLKRRLIQFVLLLCAVAAATVTAGAAVAPKTNAPPCNSRTALLCAMLQGNPALTVSRV